MNIKLENGIKIPPEIRTVLRRLQKKGYEAYIVGGCIRDSLLLKTVKDWDVCTSARPEQIKVCFDADKTADIGIKHGTVTVFSADYAVEVTTWRADGAYSDGRHPDEVKFGVSLKEDLARRDFTINAMACSDGEYLIDPFGGYDDLKRNLLRTVGQPEKRFSEDGLRILRALRFASVYGFVIEKRTKSAIFNCADMLNSISTERITAEFSKLIMGGLAGSILVEYAPIFDLILGSRCRNRECFSNVIRDIGKEEFDELPKDIICRLAILSPSIDLTAMKYDRKTIADVKKLVSLIDDDRLYSRVNGKEDTLSARLNVNAAKLSGQDKLNDCKLCGPIDKKTFILCNPTDGKAFKLCSRTIKGNNVKLDSMVNGENVELNRPGNEGLAVIAIKKALRRYGVETVRRYIEMKRIEAESFEAILASDECYSLKQLAVDGDDIKKIIEDNKGSENPLHANNTETIIHDYKESENQKKDDTLFSMREKRKNKDVFKPHAKTNKGVSATGEGKLIGEILERLLDEVVEGDLPNDREVLLRQIRKYITL